MGKISNNLRIMRKQSVAGLLSYINIHGITIVQFPHKSTARPIQPSLH